jgi:type II secretory pathway pseudopilin PulG
MARRGTSTLVESGLVLALMGILAGAIGGLAIGLTTNPKAGSAASTTTAH